MSNVEQNNPEIKHNEVEIPPGMNPTTKKLISFFMPLTAEVIDQGTEFIKGGNQLPQKLESYGYPLVGLITDVVTMKSIIDIAGEFSPGIESIGSFIGLYVSRHLISKVMIGISRGIARLVRPVEQESPSSN